VVSDLILSLSVGSDENMSARIIPSQFGNELLALQKFKRNPTSLTRVTFAAYCTPIVNSMYAH